MVGQQLQRHHGHDRLEELHALMTDEPIEVVTGRYLSWKSAATAALTGPWQASWMRLRMSLPL